MANTLKFGNGEWYGNKDTILAYNDENNNYKPLPFDFSRASSATRVNKAGLIETVGSGEPRIDFKDDTKGALLLEPSRTNNLPYSEDFSNTNWDKTSVTTTPNSEIAPDGTLTACKLDYSASTSARMAEPIYLAAGTYTFSVYLRSVSGSGDFKIRLQGSSSVNLTVSLTEEWKRFEIESDYDGTVALVPYIGYYINDSYLQEVYAWGAQLEQGSYATSYIPTSGSVVTRIADSSSQTVPDGVIGQTEGTMFLDFYWEQKSGVYFIADLSDGSSNNEIYVGIGNSSDNKVRFGINNGGLSQVSFNTEVISSGNHKLAIAYANNDVACYLDSVQIATDTNSTIPSTNKFKFSRANGTLPFSGHIKQLSLYSTRLSNAELQALTQV